MKHAFDLSGNIIGNVQGESVTTDDGKVIGRQRGYVTYGVNVGS